MAWRAALNRRSEGRDGATDAPASRRAPPRCGGPARGRPGPGCGRAPQCPGGQRGSAFACGDRSVSAGAIAIISCDECDGGGGDDGEIHGLLKRRDRRGEQNARGGNSGAAVCGTTGLSIRPASDPHPPPPIPPQKKDYQRGGLGGWGCWSGGAIHAGVVEGAGRARGLRADSCRPRSDAADSVEEATVPRSARESTGGDRARRGRPPPHRCVGDPC